MASSIWPRIRFAAVVLVVSLVALEGALLLIRHLPALSAVGPITPLARELYMLDRRMIQFEETAARWNDRLGYTLRPGESLHFNSAVVHKLRNISSGKAELLVVLYTP